MGPTFLTSVVAALATIMTLGDDGTPPTSTDDYRLERAQDGSGDLLYDATAFTARIARDGSVRFRDKHVSALALIPFFLPGPLPGVPTLEGTIRSLGRNGRKAPPRTHDFIPDARSTPASATTPYRPDPREACRYPRSCFFEEKVVLVAVWRMDITDEIMRFHRQDPYRYQKVRFLSSTGELRARLAERAHADDMRRSTTDPPRCLLTHPDAGTTCPQP